MDTKNIEIKEEKLFEINYNLMAYKTHTLTKSNDFYSAYVVAKNLDMDLYKNMEHIKEVLYWNNSVKMKEVILKELDSIKIENGKTKFLLTYGESLIQDIDEKSFLFIIINTNNSNYRRYLCTIPPTDRKFLNIFECEGFQLRCDKNCSDNSAGCGRGTWEMNNDDTAVFKISHCFNNGYDSKTLQSYLDVISNKSLKLVSCNETLDTKSRNRESTYNYEIKVKLIDRGYLTVSKAQLLEESKADFIYEKNVNTLYLIKDVFKNEKNDNIYQKPEIGCLILSENIIMEILGDFDSRYDYRYDSEKKSIKKYKGYKLIN